MSKYQYLRKVSGFIPEKEFMCGLVRDTFFIRMLRGTDNFLYMHKLEPTKSIRFTNMRLEFSIEKDSDGNWWLINNNILNSLKKSTAWTEIQAGLHDNYYKIHILTNLEATYINKKLKEYHDQSGL